MSTSKLTILARIFLLFATLSLVLAGCGQAPQATTGEQNLQATVSVLQTQIANQPQTAPNPTALPSESTPEPTALPSVSTSEPTQVSSDVQANTITLPRETPLDQPITIPELSVTVTDAQLQEGYVLPDGSKIQWESRRQRTIVVLPPQNVAETNGSSIIISQMAVHPFGYVTKDAEEGWKEGSVNFAFENISDKPASPLCLVTNPKADESTVVFVCGKADPVRISEIQVETQEGKTYPATTASSAYAFSRIEFPTPPGFPFINVYGGEVTTRVNFRFAQAAHPIRVVMKMAPGQNLPDIVLSLENVPEKIPAPNLSRYQIKPIKELAAKHLMDETNTLEMAFDGNCIYGGISGFAERGTTIPYTLTNKDKLDQKVGIIDFKSAAYYPEGVLNYDITPHDIRLGPDQTEQSYVLLLDIGRSEDSPATHLVVYEQDGSLTVYKLDCMKK